MAFKINEFRNNMAGDGARPNLFEVRLIVPVANLTVEEFTFKCKSAQIPGETIGVVTVPYFGREVKFAGTRTFAPWTVTILNDEDFAIREALETWSNNINRHEANLRDTALATNVAYRTTATVTQYSKTGVPIRTYEFVNLFPTDIAAIELSWDNSDAIQEYSVTFEYDYWRIVAPTTTGTIAV